MQNQTLDELCGEFILREEKPIKKGGFMDGYHDGFLAGDIQRLKPHFVLWKILNERYRKSDVQELLYLFCASTGYVEGYFLRALEATLKQKHKT